MDLSVNFFYRMCVLSLRFCVSFVFHCLTTTDIITRHLSKFRVCRWPVVVHSGGVIVTRARSSITRAFRRSLSGIQLALPQLRRWCRESRCFHSRPLFPLRACAYVVHAPVTWFPSHFSEPCSLFCVFCQRSSRIYDGAFECAPWFANDPLAA